MGVFFISTCLLTLIMVLVWQTNIVLCVLFFVVFVAIEGTYFSAVLSKVTQGGWVPLVIATCFLTIMFSWHYGTRMKRLYELAHKLSMDWVLNAVQTPGVCRVPGVGLVYTELPQGVPAIFRHIISNLSAIHSTLVFVCIRHIAVATVPEEERILVRRLGPRKYRMFRCAVRYGYTDHMDGAAASDQSMEAMLLASLQRFIRTEAAADAAMASTAAAASPELDTNEGEQEHAEDDEAENEVLFLEKARDAGVVYVLGDNDVHAKSDSWFFRRIVIDYIYSFLRRNCRTSALYLSIPKARLLKVGMEYYV